MLLKTVKCNSYFDRATHTPHTHTLSQCNVCAVVGYKMFSISGIGAWSVSKSFATLIRYYLVIAHCENRIIFHNSQTNWTRLTSHFWEFLSAKWAESKWMGQWQSSIESNKTSKAIHYGLWSVAQINLTEIPLDSFDAQCDRTTRHEVSAKFNFIESFHITGFRLYF